MGGGTIDRRTGDVSPLSRTDSLEWNRDCGQLCRRPSFGRTDVPSGSSTPRALLCCFGPFRSGEWEGRDPAFAPSARRAVIALGSAISGRFLRGRFSARAGSAPDAPSGVSASRRSVSRRALLACGAPARQCPALGPRIAMALRLDRVRLAAALRRRPVPSRDGITETATIVARSQRDREHD